MKISYNWLAKYLDSKLSAIEIATILTDTGLEVESTTAIGQVKGDLEGVVVGEVIECIQHPNADRLKITQVSIGTKLLQIVCGATNVAVGHKVAVALVGTTLYPTPDAPLTIKEVNIRGEASFGMLCAEDELGIGTSHSGILEFPKDTPIGQGIKNVIRLQPDYQFEIGLTPNRSDATGHIGVARDLKAFLNYHQKSKLSISWPKVQTHNNSQKNQLDVRIIDQENCSRYCSAIIANVLVGDSPEWLKNALSSIGIKPINNVVDVTNFVMHELGTPLHAFDTAGIKGGIQVRKAESNEKLSTLDGIERTLKGSELVIADDENVLCLAGIFGGQNAAVSMKTQEIFLESAIFDAISIRKTAKLHGLNTDASFRFERGVDPDLTAYALNRAVDLIIEVAGGKVVQGLSDEIIRLPKAKEIQIDIKQLSALIGLDLNDDDTHRLLLDLDFKIQSKKGPLWEITAPNYRTDVNRSADVAEEILRIIGFNAIPIPEKWQYSFLPQKGISKHTFGNQISEFLVAQGYSEIMMNSLSKASYSALIPSDLGVSLLNPLSSELSQMRQTLVFGLLETLVYNQNRQQNDLKLFEFGAIYHKKATEYVETNQIAFACTGKQEVENWNNSGSEATFFTLKGTFYSLLNRFGIGHTIETQLVDSPFFAEGLNISLEKQKIAEIGQISHSLSKRFGIKNDVYVALINWDVLYALLRERSVVFKELPKTFEVRRDFSLLIDEATSYKDIERIAYESEKHLLKSVCLFDVYEWEKIESGKKSYAVSFHFQDTERTLTDQVIDACMEKIRKNLEKTAGASLR